MVKSLCTNQRKENMDVPIIENSSPTPTIINNNNISLLSSSVVPTTTAQKVSQKLKGIYFSGLKNKTIAEEDYEDETSNTNICDSNNGDTDLQANLEDIDNSTTTDETAHIIESNGKCNNIKPIVVAKRSNLHLNLNNRKLLNCDSSVSVNSNYYNNGQCKKNILNNSAGEETSSSTTSSSTGPTCSAFRFSPSSSNGATSSERRIMLSNSFGTRTPPITPNIGFSPLSRQSPLSFRHFYNNNNSVSMRSAKSVDETSPGTPRFLPPNVVGSFVRTGSFVYSDTASQLSSPVRPPFSDTLSIRSLASIGIGSTDGKRMVIRKVPTSPSDLMNMINPPTPPDDTRSFDDSSLGGGATTDDTDSIYLKPARRQQWESKMQFVLACIGYSVGLGNVWRFPYLCYKSGGGVFLIPYFLILVICGIPMLYMELAVGQFTGRGPIGAIGHLCPIFKGAGVASVVISFLMSTYYSVLIAYAIYYIFAAFRPHAPWSHCQGSWNTNLCWIPSNNHNITKPNSSRSPSEEFFDHKVLKISSGIEEIGALRWDLVACLLCAWVIVYFAIWKSIRSSARVRYFTATFPFLLIIMFMARSVTLEGAERGLRYFFTPRLALLLDAKVWVNAISQNFNSLGIAFGSMISFASYNKYNNTILCDTLAVSFVNALTSLLVGIFTFATIGNIATEQNTSIENVIDDGPGLVFVVYPQAMAKMPASQFWSVLFFIMMLCLGLNSQFAIVEVVVTSIQDGFPKWIRKNLLYHEVLVFIICIVSFLCGLPNVTQGGIYFFQLIDHFAASISIMYLAFFEIIAVAWFYGAWRLSKNVEDMTGRPPSLYFRFCWLILTPLLLLFLWIYSLIDYTPPSYDNGRYRYPDWAVALGWAIASLSLACIPVFAIIVFIKAEGKTWKEKVCKAVLPDLFECKICNGNNCEHLEKDPDDAAELSPMIAVAGKQIEIQRADEKIDTNSMNQKV